MKSADPHRVGHTAIAIAVSLTALLGVGMAAAGDAGATGTNAPIADYSNFPVALPTGCPDGSASLIGLTFGNGRGGQSPSLRDLTLRHGDTVTMSWTGVHEACLGDGTAPDTGLSLSVYRAEQVEFDQMTDEELVGWASCGAGAPCGEGARFALSIELPDAQEACFVQVDAALGMPLRIVGPSGSFYSSSLRGSGPDMLISAQNFGGDCNAAPEPTPTPPAAPTPTAPPAPTPTTPTPTTPTPTPEVPAPKPSPTDQPEPEVQVLSVVVTRQLPATGSADAAPIAASGLLALAAGGALLATSRRLRRSIIL